VVAYRIFGKIVEHEAFAALGFVQVWLASVKKIGMPDENIAFFCRKNGFF
jgi:hypothetical protein